MLLEESINRRVSSLLLKVERASAMALRAQSNFYRAGPGTRTEENAKASLERHIDAFDAALKELRELLLDKAVS